MQDRIVDHCGVIYYDIESEEAGVELSAWLLEQLADGDQVSIDILSDAIQDLSELVARANEINRGRKQNC